MNLQVGVKVLIQNPQRQYLFIRRSQVISDESEPYWDIPGGRIHPEEGLIEALKRELDEETSLALTGDPELIMAQDIFAKNRELHVVRLTYVIKGSGDAKMSDEHQDAKWLSQEEAMKLHIDPFLKEALESLV